MFCVMCGEVISLLLLIHQCSCLQYLYIYIYGHQNFFVTPIFIITKKTVFVSLLNIRWFFRYLVIQTCMFFATSFYMYIIINYN